ncbi:hypothetical protein Taro_046179 [Colocasia esculenta]|uniref:Peroxidase n=1 Tax=Colocasia esculenta TaxID=4460 RepID=A0A843WT36_COLES|nr:hypothetical protein [Colocasia esculenta]
MAAPPLILLSLALLLHTALPLEVHFYRSSCPRAEVIAKRVLEERFRKEPSIAAALLRLFFHDCFIRGCDGSVLLDSTDDNIAEKEAPPNLTLRGFDVIDDIKAALENECRGTVSCADVLAMAARDASALSGGAAYPLPMGRRDGLVSLMSEAHLPGPSFTIFQAIDAFRGINLTVVDLITLLGAHSVGLCHCGFFVDRLYNFKGTSMPDPSMDPGLLATLKQKCPNVVVTVQNISKDPTVFMNQASATPFKLDSSFFRGVLGKKAVLNLDQQLAFADLSSALAAKYLSRPKVFIRKFSKSMVKLGNVGVLTGNQGEIRLNCRRTNNNTSSSD